MGGESAIYIYPRSLCALQQMLSLCLDNVRLSESQMPIFEMSHLFDLDAIE